MSLLLNTEKTASGSSERRLNKKENLAKKKKLKYNQIIEETCPLIK